MTGRIGEGMKKLEGWQGRRDVTGGMEGVGEEVGSGGRIGG